MRVGLVAPPWVSVPPRGYGGTETVIDNLARGLAARGHEVHLFTVGTSTCPVHRHRLYREPVVPMGRCLAEAAHAIAAYDALADMEVVHDHTVLGALVATRRHFPVPVVVTNHGPFDAEARRVFARIGQEATVVAISHDQARRALGVPIGAVIHHGVDLAAYRPGPGGDALVFVGRMSPDKGVDRALRIAHAAGRPLHIVAKMREPDERQYFQAEVRPLLGADDDLSGELDLPGRIGLLRGAHALVNPIDWPEPFGMVMIEALAVGTPVIAFDRGAASEIVTDGVTGCLVADEAAAVAAVARVGRIDRARCRREAEARFSLDRLARDHEALYRRVVADWPRPVVVQVGGRPADRSAR